MNNKQIKYELINTSNGARLAHLADDGFYYYTYTHDGIEFTGKIAPAQNFTIKYEGNY
jgi:hypothetical protein